MKTMGISEFKAQALRVLDLIAKSRESLIVTRRGKPLVQINPCGSENAVPQPGRLAETLVFEKDIVTPLGEDDWESCK
jgi:antitoxin (DNA-binding transcriptional repressor) of toxin-antitoxin stability system